MNLEQLVYEHAERIAEQMRGIAQWAESEEDLRVEVTKLIDEFLGRAGITKLGRHEYGLAGGRIDSKYGGVIIEYKGPHGAAQIGGSVDAPSTRALVTQIRQRFDDFREHEHLEPGRIFGAGCDGHRFVFVRHRGGRFEVEPPQPVAEHTVARLLRALLSLGAKGRSFTPEDLAAAFGSDSQLAEEGVRGIYGAVSKTQDPRARTFFNQWKILFGEVCGYDVEGRNPKVQKLGEHYGVTGAQPAALLFSVHTYYAIFMKLLAAEIVSSFSPLGMSVLKQCLAAPTSEALRGQMAKLEQGGIWSQLGITNFLEGDLFSWYLPAWDEQIAGVVRGVVQALDGFDPTTLSVEPAESRDLLKRLYQNLFPKSVRHDLGEYYTPDWLAEHTLNELGYDGDPDKRLLDPACGSGTFLVMAISRIKAWFEEHRDQCGFREDALVQKILQNIIGFDLNPLAVMAARTNYLLAIRDLLRHAGAIELPVYLCDSVMTPAEYGPLFAGDRADRRVIRTSAGEFHIPTDVAQNRETMGAYAEALEFCVRQGYDADQFHAYCAQKGLTLHNGGLHTALYCKLQELDANNQNGIWARIIKNAFAPLFIGQVDYVAGNPPWINWNNLPNDYRAASGAVWKYYGLWPRYLMGASADFSKLFFYVCVDTYLRSGGKIAFVITQSVFKTEGGDLFRRMILPSGEGIRIDRVDDLVKVRPFEGAANRTAVLVATRGAATPSTVRYVVWLPKGRGARGRGRDADELAAHVRVEWVAEPSSTEGTSAWLTGTPRELEALRAVHGRNGKRGVMGVHTYGANAVYFVAVRHETPHGLLVANITAGVSNPPPQVESVIEREATRPLLRGRNVAAFGWATPDRIVFPYHEDGTLMSEDELRVEFPRCFAYLNQFREMLSHRSQLKRAGKKACWYQLFSVKRSTMAAHKVVWREQSMPMAAAVVSSDEDELVVADHKLMFIEASSSEEAHYLCVLLNSSPCRLFVARSTIETELSAKMIRRIHLPTFDPADPVHSDMVAVSQAAHASRQESGEVEPDLLLQVDELARRLWELTEDELVTVQAGLAAVETGDGRDADDDAE